MDNSDPKKYDYEVFLKGAVDLTGEAPPAIVGDLVESKSKLALIYIAGSGLGYLGSLALCAQCSIGLTELSWKTAALVQAIPGIWCPIVCGGIFGLIPFIVSSCCLNSFQHRYLLFKMAWLIIVIPILASILMSIVGGVHSIDWHIVWVLSALFVPYGLEYLSFMFLRQAHYKVS